MKEDTKRTDKKLGCDWCTIYLAGPHQYPVEPKEECIYRGICEVNTSRPISFKTFQKKYGTNKKYYDE